MLRERSPSPPSVQNKRQTPSPRFVLSTRYSPDEMNNSPNFEEKKRFLTTFNLTHITAEKRKGEYWFVGRWVEDLPGCEGSLRGSGKFKGHTEEHLSSVPPGICWTNCSLQASVSKECRKNHALLCKLVYEGQVSCEMASWKLDCRPLDFSKPPLPEATHITTKGKLWIWPLSSAKTCGRPAVVTRHCLKKERTAW